MTAIHEGRDIIGRRAVIRIRRDYLARQCLIFKHELLKALQTQCTHGLRQISEISSIGQVNRFRGIIR